MLHPILLSLSMASYIFLNANAAHKEIRSDFHNSQLDEDKLEQIISSLAYIESPLTNGYKGICETMMAQYVYLPTSKLRYFNSGKRKIEAAIRQSPDNGELRYIRLLVQLNAPAMLGYNAKINRDLFQFEQFVLQPGTDKKWNQIFIDNLLSAKYLNKEHRQRLNRLNYLLEQRRA